MLAMRSNLVFAVLAAGLISCELEPTAPSADAGAVYTCSNGIDDDFDGRTHYPDDPGCESDLDPGELDPKNPRECSNGVDDDGDGKVDFDVNGNGAIDGNDDPGCNGASDDDESNAVLPACADGSDNDGDGQTDFPNDPQCSGRNDMDEAS